MLVRREVPGDAGAVARVHARAFAATAGAGQEPVEVALVAELRRSSAWLPRFSLVATVAGAVVGHVVCTRAEVGAARRGALGLGPIGVDPGHQRQGVGSALMHAVLGAADACDEPLVALLGEPDYYRRFGFVPASSLGVEAPDAGWGEVFQVRPLSAYTPEVRGPFTYAEPFGRSDSTDCNRTPAACVLTGEGDRSRCPRATTSMTTNDEEGDRRWPPPNRP